MAKAVSQYEPDSSEVRQTLDNCALELAYEKVLRQTDALCNEERARQLRVRILLLDDDNNNLHQQLAHDNDRIDELQTVAENLQSQLDTARNSLENTHSDLRLKSREIETLKVELSSLQDVTMDSTKLLTEKLALARELSSLKPEIDHLRAQTASHQAVLAEKLSLQRQLSALEVELEMGKRATERTMTKEKRMQIEDSKTAAQLETLQVELAQERKDRLKVERDAQRASADWETRRVNLESRLDSLKDKMKTTKDQLKETQNELQNTRAASRARAARPNSNIAMDEMTRDSKKRNASRMDDDTIIGTPGDSRATKQTKRVSTMPGDKSTFSITPFLNRTASVAPDSPVEERESDGERDNDGNGLPDSPAASKGVSKKTKTGGDHQMAQKSDALDKAREGKTKAGKANPKAVPARKARKAPALEQVAEEAHAEEIVAPAQQLRPEVVEGSSAIDGITEKLDAKKRKRKLLVGGLAKTLFDDDDGEVVNGDKADVRAFGTLGRVALGDPTAHQRFGLGRTTRGFGNFSPLKRDKARG